MSLYSAIQFSTVSMLYKSGSNLGDFQVIITKHITKKYSANLMQFLFIDLFLILPIAVFSEFNLSTISSVFTDEE